MTLHYHGTPITPNSVLDSLAGCHFCVSYARPDQVESCHVKGQSVMLDNGAFTFWRQGGTPDWPDYYEWADRWLDYPTTWAVIPDVIDGSVAANDQLIAEWPHGLRGVPVWHMHEPRDRLLRLIEDWPQVCIGSSGEYAMLDTPRWHRRMEQAFNAIDAVFNRIPWLHMLRGMAQVNGPYPFASVDSTDIGRNHDRPQNEAVRMARRWDARQCLSEWVSREQLELA